MAEKVECACLNPKQLAKLLGVGERQAREWIKDGKIYSFRIGRRILIPRRAVEAQLAGTSRSGTTIR